MFLEYWLLLWILQANEESNFLQQNKYVVTYVQTITKKILDKGIKPQDKYTMKEYFVLWIGNEGGHITS